MVSQMFPGIRFSSVLGQRAGIPHKPDPAGALEIANALQRLPENCAVIGDSTMDIETAHNAGMRAVAVTWGFHDRRRLVAAGADAMADTSGGVVGDVRLTAVQLVRLRPFIHSVVGAIVIRSRVISTPVVLSERGTSTFTQS